MKRRFCRLVHVSCHTALVMYQPLCGYIVATTLCSLPAPPFYAPSPSCQVYGYEYLPVLINLRKAGLLSLQEGRTHQAVRKQFRLLVQPTGMVSDRPWIRDGLRLPSSPLFTHSLLSPSLLPPSPLHPSLLPPSPSTPHYSHLHLSPLTTPTFSSHPSLLPPVSSPLGA